MVDPAIQGKYSKKDLIQVGSSFYEHSYKDYKFANLTLFHTL